jgi:Lrp/AsnC family leucine-responsive transcriptional regulator
MIDAIDQKILMILQENARTPNAEVARQLGMAASAIFERIKKLEERGVLRAYTAQIDPAALDLSLLAFVSVRTEDAVGTDFTARSLSQRPEVQEVHHVAGEDCYLAKVRVKDTAALSKLMKELGALPGVRATRTTIVLETTKESFELPIAPRQSKSSRKKESA